jgi:hypothetical protein
MVVGCDDNSLNKEDTNPSPPTGLTGTVISPNNSIQLSWNPVNRADEYWIQFKKSSRSDYQPIRGIKTTSYTFTDLDYATQYDFQVAVRNLDYYTSDYSSPISVETGNPLTANVSISIETKYNTPPSSINRNYYDVLIGLTLPEGSWWNANNITQDLIKSWVTMSGTPNVSTWSVTTYDYSSSPKTARVSISFTYSSSVNNIPISGLTATIVTNKLTEMKSYTNVVNNLTAGPPLSVSSSAWVTN